MSNSHGREWLNTKQRREIDRIDQKSHVAPPSSSVEEITRAAKFVSLTDFIEQSDWEYSDLDIIDRREIESLGAETFWLYIGESDVPLEEPGHLSPVTVAKLIALGVELVGVFIEGATKNPALLSGTDFPARVIEWALGTAWMNVAEEANFGLHFQMLMRHPVINAGVRQASWHQYRLPVTRKERRVQNGQGS